MKTEHFDTEQRQCSRFGKQMFRLHKKNVLSLENSLLILDS